MRVALFLVKDVIVSSCAKILELYLNCTHCRTNKYIFLLLLHYRVSAIILIQSKDDYVLV